MSHTFALKMPKGRELVGGDLVAQSLYVLGVDVAFGVHGGHLDAFLMGCNDIGIRLVDTRHETVAVQGAEGYARTSQKIGVCFITANSGFTNGFPGIATAYADRSPIIIITSSAPLHELESNSLQGFHDQVVLAKPVTKMAVRITNVEEIPRVVALAFRTARAGAPGPVVLDIPIDVLFSPPQMSRIAWGSITDPLPLPSAPNAKSVNLAINAIRASQRPCIIASSGSLSAGPQLAKFIETTQIPVFNTNKSSAPLSYDHPLRAGNAARLALLPHFGQMQPDLIILLGVRTGFMLGGGGGAILPTENCKYIHIDTDGSEIGRSRSIDVGIVGDATQVLLALNAKLEKAGVTPPKAPAEWVKTAVGLRSMPSPFESAPIDQAPGRPHPFHAIKAVLLSLEPGAIVVVDGGESSCWTMDMLENYSNASLYMLSTGYLAFLGNGWGYALGAALASPDRQVVHIQGDGSACFHIAELDTFVRHGLNILTVVVNNYCWGMSLSGQELLYGGITDARPVSKLSSKLAFDVVACGFDCAGARVDSVEAVADVVKRLSKVDGPACLDLIVSEKPIHPVTAMMVGTPSENMIVVPYYDNVPKPFYKC
ncbi:thiamine pyrophosphate enzyme, N-terminal TPP binding domain-containing protein [Xylogone sp. PMI_703]|nr:thiamine pyrophosphate enzyme, N-terminal TPP binding domain-containing protein [Xylogone sp. PMI_703]